MTCSQNFSDSVFKNYAEVNPRSLAIQDGTKSLTKNIKSLHEISRTLCETKRPDTTGIISAL